LKLYFFFFKKIKKKKSKMHQLRPEELKCKIMKIWNSEQEDKEDNNTTSAAESDGTLITDKVPSLHDFENEFARRYKAYLDPTQYGLNSVRQLLDWLDGVSSFPVAQQDISIASSHSPVDSIPTNASIVPPGARTGANINLGTASASAIINANMNTNSAANTNNYNNNN
ncbi:hypothetical protein RFI_10957, partial [Reticulomyxa filosa]